jgi:mannosidase alpha-like ER degradation enhancer 2
VETGEWTDSTAHIGGGIDSYYEYLLKAWLLFDDRECRDMWKTHLAAINTSLADTSTGMLWYGQSDMMTGRRTGTRFGALEAFFPAVLCLDGDTARAAALEESCYRMWNLHGIEPEEIDYSTMEVTSPGYYLRPEIIESAYYLLRTTGDQRYRTMGETFFSGLKARCRTGAGYVNLKNVITGEKGDSMESFFFAETLKYLYLIFAPEGTIDFHNTIFMTEAHPVRKIRD